MVRKKKNYFKIMASSMTDEVQNIGNIKLQRLKL